MHNQIKCTLTNILNPFPPCLSQAKVYCSMMLALGFICFSKNVDAQNDDHDWWFNVELIVFKRDLLPTNTEDFNQSTIDQITESSNHILLLQALKNQEPLSRYLHQLPTCNNIPKSVLPVPFNIQSISAYEGINQITQEIQLTTPKLTSQDGNAKDIIDQQQNLDSLINSLDDDSKRSIQELSTIDENTSEIDTFAINTLQYSVLTSDIIQSVEYQQTFQTLFESVKQPSDISLLAWLETLRTMPFKGSTQLGLTNQKDILASTIQKIEHTSNHDQNTIIEDKLNNLVSYLQKSIGSANNINMESLSISCHRTDLSVSYPKNIGINLFSDQSTFNNHIHMLNDQDLALKEFSEKVFRQRDIQPLLYTAWRENVVFGIDNAEYIRVIAGEFLHVKHEHNQRDYEEWLARYNEQQEQTIALQEIASDGDDLEAQRIFFEELEVALDRNEKVNWLAVENGMDDNELDANSIQSSYEVDGVIKVYLEYVNQVPYLHIDSKMNHYKLEVNTQDNAFIQAYPFEQRRRIISKQIHYFDHPAFGMIVRLERFIPPTPSEDESDLQE